MIAGVVVCSCGCIGKGPQDVCLASNTEETSRSHAIISHQQKSRFGSGDIGGGVPDRSTLLEARAHASWRASAWGASSTAEPPPLYQASSLFQHSSSPITHHASVRPACPLRTVSAHFGAARLLRLVRRPSRCSES